MKQTAVEWLGKELESYGDPEYCKLEWETLDSLIQQAKEMEKKQNIGFAEFVASYTDKNKNVNGEMLHAKSKYDGAERTIDLLEIYTKNNWETRGTS